ncbi:MAG: DUF1553 domain-containing protein, partial [Pirellulaceae bacterium]
CWIGSACLAALLGLPTGRMEADGVDYLREVRPLLDSKCGACHGAVRQQSGLRLDAGRLIHSGGDSGPAVVPGKSADSLIIARVTGADGESQMPPEGEGKPLTAAEVDLLRRWIDAGAGYPADEEIPVEPSKHWAYQRPIRSTLPATRDPHWSRNPIDRFIAARRDADGQTPAAEADRATLLRRVYLDLIGLPPTREALHAFLDDPSEAAYDRVVDGLLERPEYGERWGRHWMDVWRYCDWHGSGNEIRYSQRHIWHWRDWIVRSLNADKGYDRMIVEMLAGDEVAPDDPDTVAATGFVARNWYKFDRNVWMRELVEHTAVGFLGTSLKCARCHDHKFDPISQEEYYRFRAFFEPHHVRTDRLSAAPELESFVDVGPVWKDGLPRAYDRTLDAPTFLFERGDDRYPVKDRPLAPGVPEVFGGAELSVQPVSLPVASYAPMLQPAMVADLQRAAEEQVVAAERAWQAAPRDVLLAKRLEQARAERRALRGRIAADQARHVERAPAPRVDELSQAAARSEREASLLQAEVRLVEAEQALAQAKQSPATDDKSKQTLAKAETAATAARKALADAQAKSTQSDAQYTPVGEVYPTTSTGRRLALARWIADEANPLTARVAINQIWMRHFGRPLVDTVADFGMRAAPPSHPELLDWLAVEFVERGWSMKHVHRLIVTSATYRQSSVQSTAGNDPATHTNRLFTHMNSRRLEAESVRDTLLFLGGLLDNRIGGREIPYGQDQDVPRRSLYFQTAPNRQSMLLTLFDAASTEECYERKPSVIPQQSLALMNSALAARVSQRLAERLGAFADAEFVMAAFEEILNRPPAEAEQDRCQEFLESQTRWLAESPQGPVLPENAAAISVAQPARRARENLVLVLLNHNDFVTVR